jgi:hypothetical protein
VATGTINTDSKGIAALVPVAASAHGFIGIISYCVREWYSPIEKLKAYFAPMTPFTKLWPIDYFGLFLLFFFSRDSRILIKLSTLKSVSPTAEFLHYS